MKSFFKTNAIFILSFLILLSIGLFNYAKEVQRDTHNNQIIEKHKVMCQNGEINSESYCDSILKDYNKSTDFYYMFHEVSTFSYTRMITLFLIIFIIVPSLYYSSKYLKNKMIVQDLTRTSYKKVKKKLFLNAYKSIFIIPGVCVILFILCYLYLRTFAITISHEAFANAIPNNLFVAYLIQLISLFIQSAVCINLGLIVLRKHHNYFITIILTYILYWTIELILEVFVEGILINQILKISYVGRLCSLVNGFVVPIDTVCLICPFIILILTSVIICFKYSNKEKLIIDCEGGKE